MTRNRLKSLAISVAALLLTVLALEIPALFGWTDYRFTIGLARRVREPKPYPPDTAINTAQRGDLVTYYGLQNAATRDIRFRTDRHGFRNAADLERAAVLVVGDSFVLNPTISQAQLFTTILDRRLGMTVANLSHSGWGPNNELGALRRVGLTLQPRVVLWVFYEGNDLADALVYGGHEIDWSDRLFLTNAYLRAAAGAERVLFGETRRNYGREGGTPFGSCTLRCSERPCQRIYFGNLAGPLSLFDEIAVRTVFDVLTKAGTETRDHGSALVLVYAPVTLRVYHDVCEFDENNRARTSTLNDLPNRMRSWATSKGIGFVDLTAALTTAAARGELVYYPDDTHWTDLGNAVVANALASAPAIVKALAAGG